MQAHEYTKKGMIIILSLGLIGGIGIGYAISRQEEANDKVLCHSTETPSPTPSIQPTPYLTPTPFITKEKVANDIQEQINTYITDNNINRDNLGVYFHDFSTDATYALNEDNYFIAASTYKLPLAVYYYELIYDGQCSPDDSITVAVLPESNRIAVTNLDETESPTATPESEPAEDTEEPEPEYYTDTIGDLLHSMILYSDNIAAQMLYQNMGGWNTFRIVTAYYYDGTYSDDNTFTPAYMNAILQYIYEHTDLFPTLLEDMLESEPDAFLNFGIGDIMEQKYGDFGGALNAVGLSSYGKPYSIVVFTYCLDDSMQVIGDINQICYNYLNK